MLAEILAHPIPAVAIMLGVLVSVHEFGHYLVGRLCGIAVETFSIGFGPRILGFRRGGIDYRLSWIPLGGYVKFIGAQANEELPAEMNGIPYRDAATWKRALTILAGPMANFLLAVIAYMVLGMTGIPHPPAWVGEVIPGGAADHAGFMFGDQIIKMDGREIKNWRDMEQIIAASPEKTLSVEILRQNQVQALTLIPAAVEATDLMGKPAKIGRAGVARGRLPAIVSIEANNSPAAQAGLRTGDQIIEVGIKGQTWPIRAYAELVQVMQTVSQIVATDTSDLQSLQIVAQETKPDDAGPKVVDAAKRHLVLDARVMLDVPGRKDGRLILQQLGIRDSQLTVGKASNSTEKVLQQGDILLRWKEQSIRDIYQLQELLLANTQQIVPLTIARAGEMKKLDVSLQEVEVQKPEGPATLHILPVIFWGQPQEPEPLYERYTSPLAALQYGVKETWQQSVQLIDGIKSLITGEVPLKALGGPMLIAKVAGESARRGWQTFLSSMSLISINLGLLNLFPIPVLDGGQLLLTLAEALRGRPLRERAIESFQKIGFAMVMALVVLATYNDFSRFWKSMLSSVSGAFR